MKKEISGQHTTLNPDGIGTVLAEGSKPLRFLIRFVSLQWNRKRQYAGSKTASDRKRKTSVTPLLWH